MAVSQIKSSDCKAQKNKLVKGEKKSAEAGARRSLADLCTLWSHIFDYRESFVCFASFVVGLFSYREPAQRVGAKTGTNRKDAQLHPHPAGPTYQLVRHDFYSPWSLSVLCPRRLLPVSLSEGCLFELTQILILVLNLNVSPSDLISSVFFSSFFYDCCQTRTRQVTYKQS